MAIPKVNPDNMNRIKKDIDDALADMQGAPMNLIVKTVLYVLDSAHKEGRLNSLERIEACKYLSKVYGYDF